MKISHIVFLVSAVLLTTACGKKDSEQAAKISSPAASTPIVPASAPIPETSTNVVAPPPAPSEPIATHDRATRYIDHGKDEIEFRLKKSLAGLESMLETVSDAEQIATMKKDMAELQSQLDAL